MSYNLARYGKWGLVTGASSGIGLEFARAIAAEGLNLILVARRRERLESLAAELRERNGIEAQVIVMDLTCLKELEGLTEQVGSKELGLLVLNAGYGYYGRFVDQTEDDLEKMITLNCTSTALLARKLLPGMIQRKKGAVIIVSSVLGFFPRPLDFSLQCD